MNGTIGKQMVDTLVESASNVELILKYFDMFLKLKDLVSSPSFLEVDLNNDGWVYPKDFKEKMELQKSYTKYVYKTLPLFILFEFNESLHLKIKILKIQIPILSMFSARKSNFFWPAARRITTARSITSPSWIASTSRRKRSVSI